MIPSTLSHSAFIVLIMASSILDAGYSFIKTFFPFTNNCFFDMLSNVDLEAIIPITISEDVLSILRKYEIIALKVEILISLDSFNILFNVLKGMPVS